MKGVGGGGGLGLGCKGGFTCLQLTCAKFCSVIFLILNSAVINILILCTTDYSAVLLCL